MGIPFFVRIGYGKKSKTKKRIEDLSAVDLDKSSLMRNPSKWKNQFYDVENSKKRCAKRSIANSLFHLGEETIY